MWIVLSKWALRVSGRAAGREWRRARRRGAAERSMVGWAWGCLAEDWVVGCLVK